MDDSHVRRAYSLGSSDKPKKKANPTNSYDLPQSHNEGPSSQQVSEEASPSGPPSELCLQVVQCASCLMPLVLMYILAKVVREGAKNVKVYPTEPGKKAPFFVMSQVCTQIIRAFQIEKLRTHLQCLFCFTLQSVYKGHSCTVVHCKFSPNGAFIASVDTSQVVK